MARKLDLGVSAVALMLANGGAIATAHAAAHPDSAPLMIAATAAYAAPSTPRPVGSGSQSDWNADARDYVWIDNADRLLEAIGEAPPDFVFDFEGEDAWGWETSTGNFVLAEASGSDSVRYYYYDPDGDTPFLVQERHLSFAFEDNGLAAVYDETGAILPPEETAEFDADAGELFERGYDLRVAATYEDQWDAVDAGWWAGQISLIIDMRSRWTIGRAQHPGWINWYRSNHAYRWRMQLHAERERRRMDSQRFQQWQRDGFRGPVPQFAGRPAARRGNAMPSIRAPRRDAAGRPIIASPGTPRPRILQPQRPSTGQPAAPRPNVQQPGAQRPSAQRPPVRRDRDRQQPSARPPQGQPVQGQMQQGRPQPVQQRPNGGYQGPIPQRSPMMTAPGTQRPAAPRPDAAVPPSGRPQTTWGQRPGAVTPTPAPSPTPQFRPDRRPAPGAGGTPQTPPSGFQQRRMPEGATPRETPPTGTPIQTRPTPQVRPAPQAQPTPQVRPAPQAQPTAQPRPTPQPTARATPQSTPQAQPTRTVPPQRRSGQSRPERPRPAQ